MPASAWQYQTPAYKFSSRDAHRAYLRRVADGAAVERRAAKEQPPPHPPMDLRRVALINCTKKIGKPYL